MKFPKLTFKKESIHSLITLGNWKLSQYELHSFLNCTVPVASPRCVSRPAIAAPKNTVNNIRICEAEAMAEGKKKDIGMRW